MPLAIAADSNHHEATLRGSSWPLNAASFLKGSWQKRRGKCVRFGSQFMSYPQATNVNSIISVGDRSKDAGAIISRDEVSAAPFSPQLEIAPTAPVGACEFIQIRRAACK